MGETDGPEDKLEAKREALALCTHRMCNVGGNNGPAHDSTALGKFLEVVLLVLFYFLKKCQK